jgi:uncharacterized radical SAM protein YgiQ
VAFLAFSEKDIRSRGWDRPDIVLVTGDAYVDHPSYGAAVIGRVLEAAGFMVGIIAQPDWRTIDDFRKLGKPGLFFGITAGNLDSMVANYTSAKRPRKKDSYSPGGTAGLRPDRAAIVYANRVREAYGDVPIVIGGIEASLRRFAHYDWWDNSVRRSILVDSRADILVYGMGEKQIVEIARRIRDGNDLAGIRGTTILKKLPAISGQRSADAMQETEGISRSSIIDDRLSAFVEIPSYEEVKEDKDKFNEAFKVISLNQDPMSGTTIVQRHATHYVMQFPPPLPMKTSELDHIYDLPYEKAWHPSYDKGGGVPGFETVRFSIIAHRGCCGECSFCSLSMHQGRIVQSRSKRSIVEEAKALAARKDFRGTITDIGGPTANLYQARCARWENKGACNERSCLVPEVCRNLKPGYREGIELYKEVMRLPGVRHVFIESGSRYDLLVKDSAEEYLRHICAFHISGQMKVAPEHCVEHVLKIMNKPSFGIYEQFVGRFEETKKKTGKKLFLVNYFISAHPGATLSDALELSRYLRKKGIHPEQVQDFTPLPLTLSGTIYHTEKDPYTGRRVYVAKTFRERKMHRALIQYNNPKNRQLIREAMRLLRQEHV